MKRKKIIAMGFMGQMPIAGVIWQHLHYIVGLQRLGHEVYYIEDTLNPCYDPRTFDWSTDLTYAAASLDRLARTYDFHGRWAMCERCAEGEPTVGLSKARMIELYREADAIINICGSQEFNEDILQCENLIYIESDPAVEQIKVDKGNAATLEYLQRHRSLFSFGENIGSADFPVPLHGLRWLPTRQPVVTDLWKTSAPPPPEAVFTSVANWNTLGTKDIEWRGDHYLWSKSLEFLKFIQAPQQGGEPFELATGIPDAAIRERFLANGWRLADPGPLSVEHDQYRSYLQDSKGEFTVAKDQYVRLNTGWFSDRSACYLACGRPVITQETGFTQHYGGHGGLFGFSTLEEITEALARINADYSAHCRAAYEVAAEHFEATKVLASLLDRAGI